MIHYVSQVIKTSVDYLSKRDVRRDLFFDSQKCIVPWSRKFFYRTCSSDVMLEIIWKLRTFDWYRFFSTRSKKNGPRSTMTLDRRCFFKWQSSCKGCQLIIQLAYWYADSALLFIQHCCIFVFFAFRPNVPLVFFFFFFHCDRIGNEMPCRRKIFGHEKTGSIWQKNDGDAHPYLS